MKLASPGNYNVFSPAWGLDFISPFASYGGYPIIATLPEGYPVTIEAVKLTEGRYFLCDIPFTHVQLILSLEHPSVNKRLRIASELEDVEPFKGRKGDTTAFSLKE